MNNKQSFLKGFHSIKTKMIIVMLFLVIFSVVAVKLYDYTIRVPEIEKTVTEERLNTAVLTASRLETELSKSVITLEATTNNSVFVSNDKNEIIKKLQFIKKQNPLFASIFFVDSSLNRMNEKGEVTSLATREYMQETKKTQKTVISREVLISQATNKPAIMLASPIKIVGAPESYIGITINIDSLQDIIEQQKKSNSNYVFAVDGKNGMVFAHPVKEYIGSLKIINTDAKDDGKVGPELHNLVKEAVAGKTGTVIYEFNGSKIVSAYTNIPGTSFGIVSRMDYYDAMEPVRNERNSAIVITSIVSLIAALLAYLFAQMIVNPIIGIAKQAEVIASGDFTLHENAIIKSNDEVGQLQKAFKNMSIMLTSIMGQIGQASEQLAASSQQLNASAEESTQGANEVAQVIAEVAIGATEQVEEINNTLEGIRQISAAINDIAQNASVVAGVSGEAAKVAIDGETSISHAVNTMEDINSTVQGTVKVIRNLGMASAQISQIVDAITAIAGQTNLLALNAAIEAARAGEHGRGFSVVADEIRKLAEQSKQSTNTIVQIIDSIQSQTKDAIEKMDESAEKVSVGQDVVLAAGKSFKEIKEYVDKVNDSVQGITAATEELSASSNEVINTVEKIKIISQETEENSHTISASAQEQSVSMEGVTTSVVALAELAIQLDTTLKRFKFNQ